MADGPTEPEPDEGGRPEEGRVLSPEELDITESDHVEQIDEDRFVVSSNARAGGVPGNAGQTGNQDGSRREPASDQSPDRDGESESVSSNSGSITDNNPNHQQTEELTQEAVHEWLRGSFAGNPSRYGFDITGTFDGSVSQRRMASNDVVTIFESLVLWYAQQVDTDTPVEEVLGILLMEANVPVRYPPESLQSLVRSAGLGPEDTIADLLAAVEDDGLKL
jgi:hypothetical protein